MKKKKRRIKKKVKVFFIIFLLIILSFIIAKWKNQMNLVGYYFDDVSPVQEIGKLKTIHKYDKEHYISHVINYPEMGKKKIDKEIKKIINNLIDDFNKKYNSKTINHDEKYYQYVEYESYLAPDGLMSIIFMESREINAEEVDLILIHPYVFDLKSCELAKDTSIFIGDYKKIIKDYLINFLPNEDEYKNVLKGDYKEFINDNMKYAINNKGVVVYYDEDVLTENFEDYVDVTIPFDKFIGHLNINALIKSKKLTYGSKNDKEDEKYTSISKTMYTEQMVNLYSEDSRNSDTITNLNKGTKVYAISSSNIGWTKVKYKDMIGYVSSNMLSYDIVILDEMVSVDETVYAISDVNIREEESVESNKLGLLKRKDSIKRIGISDSGWSEVLYNDEIAYIASSYLSTEEPKTEYKIKIDPSRGIDPNGKMVSLTFDDGPNPKTTEKILDVLEKYHAVATFFDVGNLVESYPNTVKREEAIGCEVGTHTYNHPNLNTLDIDEINNQISKSNNAFKKAIGHDVKIIRAPYGNSNENVRNTINMPFIYWSIDTEDWKSRDKNAIINEINKYDNLDGQIILMHGIYQETALAVAEIVPKLILDGYQLVTVSELAKYKGYNLENGTIYYSFK